MDVRADADEFLAAPKTILGPPTWVVGARPETRLIKRNLLQEGEAVDAFLHTQAYPNTNPREFRYLIVFRGLCIARIDFAPTIDGSHFNPLSCPADYPVGKVDPLHYHSWKGNRQFGSAKSLPQKLLCACEIKHRIDDIDQAFWWFCHDNQILAESSDVPGWPPLDRLL